MQIDRHLFFVLTAAIAGAACASTSGTAAAPPSAQPEALKLPDGRHAQQRAVPDVAVADPEAPAARGPEAGGDEIASASPAVRALLEKKAIEDDDDDCTKDAKVTSPAPKCDDSKAPPAMCGVLSAPDTEGCGPQTVRSRCRSAVEKLKPRVALAASQCMARHNGAPLCRGCAVERCQYEAMMGACPSPAAARACADLSRSCNGVNVARCEAMLSGLNDEGLSEAVACVKKGCRSLWSCAGQ